MNRWFYPLLFLLASSTEDDLRRQIEFMQAEIEMLRRRVPKKRIFLDNEEREQLLKLGEAIGTKVTKLITIACPRTYQRWLRNKSQDRKPAKRMGRTRIPETIKEIIPRIAYETGWGYGKRKQCSHKTRSEFSSELPDSRQQQLLSSRIRGHLRAADVQVISTAIRAPNQNAYVERWIGSIKQECLNPFIVFGNCHLNHIVSEYVDYYNEFRPHQHKGNRPLTGVCLAGNEPLGEHVEIVCHSRLGGVLRHYVRLAA